MDVDRRQLRQTFQPSYEKILKLYLLKFRKHGKSEDDLGLLEPEPEGEKQTDEEQKQTDEEQTESAWRALSEGRH